jgi:LmbE family N-acetylglucosaminyl deacetylase
MRYCFAFILTCILSLNAVFAQDAPRVLIVIAHPDDETAFAATIYKITKELHGVADLFLVTNGEGGYKYSTLAEAYYGKELTEEKVGREFLPQIRKQELQNAGRIIGIRNFTFMDQKDAHYGLDEHEPLDTSWHVAQVQARLRDVLAQGNYDFLFCLLPVPATHGGHKAATLLALRTVRDMKSGRKPVVLGGSVARKGDTIAHFSQLKNYTETKTLIDTPLVSLDRTTKFGYKNSLDYRIIVNWEIAEHKSQGAMQLGMNGGDYEQFWYFALNEKDGIKKTEALFERLKLVPYRSKTY